MINQQLKEARESQSLSLEQAAQSTRIRLHYLKALEAGNYSALPSPAQARGFVRSYAAYLGLDPQSIVAALAAEVPGSLAVDSRPQESLPALENKSQEAEDILHEIGARLKTQRELLELTLEDIELHTHIRVHYLLALEAGSFKDLPSPVQGRGMLNNYASFLGMDAEPLLLRYAEALQARLNARQAAAPRRRSPFRRQNWSEKSLLQRLLSVDFLLGSVVVVFLLSFVVWAALRVTDLRGTDAQFSASQTAASPLSIQAAGDVIRASTATATVAPLAVDTPVSEHAVPPFAVPEQTNPAAAGEDEEASMQLTQPAPSGSGAVQLYVVVKQRTWMRVLVDDKPEFEGRVAPGGAYQFYGDRKIEILTGNGAGLQVFYNQVDQGMLGMFGEVVNRLFTIEGIQTPTATLTPTGRPAPTETPTPQGMETGTPSPTPTQTPPPTLPVGP